MTKRQEIEKVAKQYGWSQYTWSAGRAKAPEFLALVRQPTPDAPRLLVEVQFIDVEGTRVAGAWHGTGRIDTVLSGGTDDIKKHLRQNGVKK